MSRSTIFELESLQDKDGNLRLNNNNMSESEALELLKDNIQEIEENNLIPKLLINEVNDILDSYNFSVRDIVLISIS